MIQKLLSLALVASALLFSVTTTAEAESWRNFITERSAVSGADYTSSPKLAQKLDTIFDGDANIYTDKACTDPVDTVLGSSPVRNNGIPKYVGDADSGAVTQGTSCYIYANGVYYTLFGEAPQNGVPGEHSELLSLAQTASRRASYENFKAWGVRPGVGALIRASGHSMILLDYDAQYITYLDGNGDGQGLVSINKETWEQFYYPNVSYIVQPKEYLYSDLYACGMCGNNLFWSVDNGTLTISGSGDILYPAWSSYQDSIEKLVIRDRSIGIGNGAFYNCSNLKEIVFLDAAPVLSQDAFWGVQATVHYPATKGGWAGDILDNYGGTLTWEPYGMTELRITAQPQTVFAHCGEEVSVSVAAEGDGLTYSWYIKRPGDALYTRSAVTGLTYCAVLSEFTKDLQVLCVVKDQYGGHIVSERALLRINDASALS